MLSTVSPAAAVIAVPAFRLPSADDVGLRTTDPVVRGAAPRRALVGLLEVRDECLGSRSGCCMVCVCETGFVASLLLDRDVSVLQPAPPMTISASAAACGETRQHNISKARDIALLNSIRATN